MAAQRVQVHELERQRDALEAALRSEQRLQEAEHGNPRAGVSRLRLELGALNTANPNPNPHPHPHPNPNPNPNPNP